MGLTLVSGCSPEMKEEVELRHFPVDSLEELETRSKKVQLDNEITSDGNGSLRIEADSPATVQLFQTGDVDIENSRLIYRAKLRTQNVEGQVYLEMWCVFNGKRECFSRALQAQLSGSSDCVSQETPFFPQKGENPDNIKLYIVVDGKATVWVDDIRLLKTPL